MIHYFKCKIGEAEVEVEADCRRGSCGSWEEPPEGPEIEIRAVTFEERDITKLLERRKQPFIFDTLSEDCGIQFEEGAYD